MSDITINEADTTSGQAPVTEPTFYTIPVTKGKASIEINIDDVPNDVYKEALLLGLKELVNRGMSKVTVAKLEGAELDKAKAAAMAIAAKNVEAIKTSKIKFAGKKTKSGESAAVMTEALRLAKNLVKDEIKRAGGKISHYKASEITLAAKELLAQDESLVIQAKANLEEREKTPVKVNIMSLIKEDPELVKKADAKKAEKKVAGLSAKQAGMTKTRAKPTGATAH